MSELPTDGRRERGMRWMQDLGAPEMAALWGLVRSGGRLTNPHKLATGGEPSLSDAYLALATYVETTQGFTPARPLLAWVFIRFKELDDYPYRLPHEDLLTAGLRHGQLQLARFALTRLLPTRDRERYLARALLDGFLVRLAGRLKAEPFLPPQDDCRDHDEIGALVADVCARAERKFPTHRRR